MDLGILDTTGTSWDLRFRRYQVGTNSGASGSGNGGACSTGLTDLNAVTSLEQFSSATAGECSNFVADTMQDLNVSNRPKVGITDTWDITGRASYHYLNQENVDYSHLRTIPDRLLSCAISGYANAGSARLERAGF